jgi:hypothetical protein
MIIIKSKPYIIKKINNSNELKIIQDYLYEQGYYFLGGKITNSLVLNFSQYPFYISNLSYLADSRYTQIKRRIEFNQPNNNVLWMADFENEFDLSKLRYEKLCTISEL